MGFQGTEERQRREKMMTEGIVSVSEGSEGKRSGK